MQYSQFHERNQPVIARNMFLPADQVLHHGSRPSLSVRQQQPDFEQSTMGGDDVDSQAYSIKRGLNIRKGSN
jgi:hypothetical protein